MKKRSRKQIDKSYQFKLVCETKNRYESEAKARDAAEFHMLENMNIDLDVYLCPVCGNWHLTSVKEEKS